MTLPQRPNPPTAPTTQIPRHPAGTADAAWPQVEQSPLGTSSFGTQSSGSPAFGPRPAVGPATGGVYGGPPTGPPALPPGGGGPWLTVGGRSFNKPGPVAVAAAVAGLLVVFGVGAIVVPALSGNGSTPASPATGHAAGVAPPAAAVTSDPANPDVISDTSTPTAGATTAHPTQSTVSGNPGFEQQVVSLVNEQRHRAHCEPVRMDDRLRTAARAHSSDMAVNNFVDHTGSDGSSPQDRMRQAGYNQGLSENLDRGHNSPQDVMKAWMHNGDDRGNILNCAAKAIGVGIAFRGKTPYWTQNFGRG